MDQFHGESLLSVATQSEFSPQLAHWSTQHSSTSGKRYPIPRRTTRCLAQLFMHVTIGELALLPAAVKKNIKVTGESTAARRSLRLKHSLLFCWGPLSSSAVMSSIVRRSTVVFSSRGSASICRSESFLAPWFSSGCPLGSPVILHLKSVPTSLGTCTLK